jgi:hypothetical protein
MVVPMGTNPFIKSPFSRQTGFNRRRSTRVDFIVPIILSGRDAQGQTFREDSQTKSVNLHGAKLKTTREILVGMQVCIENPMTAAAEKGVCVRIEENVPGENSHYIAVQLVRPGNIWGLPKPPADWTVLAANTLRPDAAPPQMTDAELPVAPPADSPSPIIESQAVTWEQQSTDLVESVMQILRRQAEALSSVALQEFEKRLKLLEREAAERLEQRAAKTLADVSSLADDIREDMVVRIAAAGNVVADAAESDLRAKVAEILTPLLDASGNILPGKPAETFPRK